MTRTTREMAEAAFRAGATTTADLARALGVRQRQATRWLNKVAPPEVLEARRQGAHAERIVELHDQGYTVMQIVEEVRVSDSTVRRTLRRAQKLPAPRRDLEERRARIEQLLREGMPCTWIVEDTGADIGAVYRVRRRLGMTGNDFAKVWSSIRVNPTLYALHCQFAPKAGL